jgi:predicted phage-related endonuclease
MLFPKTRDEWLKIRESHISSTESAALFGMSPYMTIFELAVLKKDPTLDDFTENERMTWGKRLERAIAQGIAEDYGVKVRAISGYASLGDHKMGASFDYEIVGLKELDPEKGDFKAWEVDQTLRNLYTDYGPGVLEIKNVDGFVYKNDWKDDEAPAHIEIQVQHQLHAIERNWAAIGVLVGGNKQVLLTRTRDWDVGAKIQAKIGKFWRGIAAGHMPPVTFPQDADIIRQLYKYAEPNSVLDYQKEADEAGDRLHQLAWQHDEATKLKSAAEQHHKATGAALLMAMGTTEKALFIDMTVNASTVGPAHVKAYDRAGYRNLRVYPKKSKEVKS